jgi:hypothetical protein
VAIVYLWWRRHTTVNTEVDLQISNHATIPGWFRRLRNVAVHVIYGFYNEMIGGEGAVVEIDESKFGKRKLYSLIGNLFAIIIFRCIICIGKYERGYPRDGVWIFGGVERGTDRCFLIPVKNRSAAVLIPEIQKYIRPGTTIISDCWKAYRRLP